MLIQEIIMLNEWLVYNESAYGVMSKLNQLNSILVSNVDRRNRNSGQALQSFTEQKNLAIDAVRNINLGNLSNNQIECLRVYNVVEFFGPKAADVMIELFRDEVHDIVYLADKIQKICQTINNASNQILAAAKIVMPYAKALASTDYLGRNSRFSIIFREGVKVESLKELEIRAKEWSVIMHGIGVALGIPPNEFRIIGARNGSFVIDLYMAAAAIVPIGIILTRSFTLLEQFALSMRRINEIFSLDLKDSKFVNIEKKIKSASDEYFKISKTIASKDISEKVLDDLGCDSARREEADAHLQKSIKKILDHLRKGGDLDAFIPDVLQDAGENNSAKLARTLIYEFRHKKIEQSSDLIKLLEYFQFDDTDNEENG